MGLILPQITRPRRRLTMFMKKNLRNHSSVLLVLLSVWFISPETAAQQNIRQWIEEIAATNHFESTDLFIPVTGNSEQLRNQLPVRLLQIDQQQLQSISLTKPAALRLRLPINGNDQELLLARTEILSPDFHVGTLGIGATDNITYSPGTYYRGVVDGDFESIVAITVFSDEISGMISTGGINYELVKDPADANHYFLYDAHKLPSKPDFNCESIVPPGTIKTDLTESTSGIGCKVVTVYFECDYRLFQDKGSNTTNVANYVTSLFNQVATLYFNENIDIQISNIYVWTSTDPYASYTSSSNLLSAFRSTRGTNFTGTLAHFLTTRNIGGGIAYLDVLCNKSYAHGASYIYNTFSNVPTYSWSVEVVTHELGHNFGSNHTQWCGWTLPTGGTGALDNCYTTEGGCARGPAPTNGGTIMSYCHLTSTGINFTNGFGTQPGDKIRSKLIAASCIAAGGVVPTGLLAQNITTNTADLSWNVVSGATTYTVQYRTQGSSTWLTGGSTGNTSLTLTSLTAGTNYEWQVKTDCSVFSSTSTFLTTGGATCSAPTGLTTSSITSSGATLSWSAVTGAVSYTVQYKTSAATTWITANATVSTTFVLSGLTASTTYNWKVTADCSVYSSTVSFTTASSGCTIPTGLNVSNLTRNSATLNWNASSGATNYTIRYKKVSSNKWTQIGPVTATSVNITALSGSTAYEWRVKSNCSNYTNSSLFTTPAAMISSEGKQSDPVSVYPNPASTELIVLVQDHESFGSIEHLSISDLIGKKVMDIPVTEQEIKIDISLLPDGIYILQIRNTVGQLTNKRFMKKQ